MGNTHPKYKETLRKLRPLVEKTHEQIASFRFEVDQRTETDFDRNDILAILRECHEALAKMLQQQDFDIPVNQRDDIRNNMAELFILQRAIEGYPVAGHQHFVEYGNVITRSLQDIPLADSEPDLLDDSNFHISAAAERQPLNTRLTIGRGIEIDPTDKPDGRFPADEKPKNRTTSTPALPKWSTSDFNRRRAAFNYPAGPDSLHQMQRQRTPEMTRILLARLQSALDNLREFMRWMDGKLERKWWLKETVRWLRTMLLLGTFISASAAVMYPKEWVPYITLGFTITSGAVDIIDQIFVKGSDPEKVRTVGLKRTRYHPV